MSAVHPERGGLDASIIVPFATVVLIWSSTWIVIKDQVGLAPLGWTVVARFAIATFGAVALALIRRESLRIGRVGMMAAALIGLCQFCLNFQFVYRAEVSLTSGIMAIMMALMTIPTAVFSWLIFKTPLDRRFLAGSAVALGGIGLLLLNEYRTAPPAGEVGAGLRTHCPSLGSPSPGIHRPSEVRTSYRDSLARPVVMGSIAVNRPRCRCGVRALPELPQAPITWPRRTSCPTATCTDRACRCTSSLYRRGACWMITKLPPPLLRGALA